MKQILLIFSFVVLISSCSNNERVAKNKMEDFITKNSDDPKSYEFINIEQDTILKSEHILWCLKCDSSILVFDKEFYKDRISSLEWDKKNGFYNDSSEKYITELSTSIKKTENEIKYYTTEYNKINGDIKDSIFRIVYTLNYRIKNSNGGYIKTLSQISYTLNQKKWSDVYLQNK